MLSQDSFQILHMTENDTCVAHHRCIYSGQPLHQFFDLISY